MRLTNSTLLRGYNRSLNRLRNAKNDCEKKITSTRSFSRASEAPLSAAKALNVRKSQYYSAQYKENLKVASKFYTEAETSLLQVSEKMADIRETIIAAVNTTKDIVDYNIYAQQLETRAQELCAIFNTDSAGRSIFGGDSDNAMPFNIINDSDGRPATVLYHGVPVNAMNNWDGFPYSDRVYMDVGIGMVTDQQAHTQDPMSVLDISFHGTEITGCGADYGVADIDLSSIQENRTYAIDIYAEGRKQTITFQGKGTQQDNVDQINELLADAYRKDKSHGKSVPVMDDQGMIYLTDANGKPLEKGVVSAVNNTAVDSRRSELLVIDNDSNYTNKFKIKANNLPENMKFRLDVEVDGERKEISFTSGADDFSNPLNLIYREDVTIQNFQKALDDAFGAGKVNVTTHAPNKGVVSSEGSVVKLWGSMPLSEEEKAGAAVSTRTVGTLDFNSMVHDGNTQYTVRAEINGVEYEKVLTTGTSRAATHTNLFNLFKNEANATGHMCNENTGVCTFGDVAVNFLPSTAANAAPIKTDYNVGMIDPTSLENGKEYEFKVIINNNLRNVTIKGGADAKETVKNMRDAIRNAFGGRTDIYVGGKGEVVTLTKEPIQTVGGQVEAEDMLFERERIYSNNYIQLTLDAARSLRNGDIEYANGCIDRIVTASEKLLSKIADLGCNEDFIDFNLERITTREENLAERQNDLEIADPEYQITLWKTFEAYYNACLQMSSSVIPNSIFNYMK
ncbi:MAG: hypothetical protein K2N56_01040 [Oscillospiraceae bacterium]|nr:hypothetical protein [Oscillospiraceae bacterium]